MKIVMCNRCSIQIILVAYNKGLIVSRSTEKFQTEYFPANSTGCNDHVIWDILVPTYCRILLYNQNSSHYIKKGEGVYRKLYDHDRCLFIIRLT